MEHNIPHWLQKELDQFGVFQSDPSFVATMTKNKRYESKGWKPSYLGEEPPY